MFGAMPQALQWRNQDIMKPVGGDDALHHVSLWLHNPHNLQFDHANVHQPLASGAEQSASGRQERLEKLEPWPFITLTSVNKDPGIDIENEGAWPNE